MTQQIIADIEIEGVYCHTNCIYLTRYCGYESLANYCKRFDSHLNVENYIRRTMRCDNCFDAVKLLKKLMEKK